MLGASVDLGTSKHIGKAKGALIMGGMFGKNPLTLEQQLALVEPMPKQTGYKDRYRSDKDPFRIGREFRQLTVFPNDFWDNVEAFYAQNFGSVADFDMDPFIEGFFAASATEARSFLEWQVLLLALRNFYRLQVWTSTHVSRCSPRCLRPVLNVLAREHQADALRLVGFVCEAKVMDGIETWKTTWDVAASSGAEDTFLREIAEGYLQAARSSSYKAEYVGRAALLFAQANDRARATKLFEEALGYAQADDRVYVALHDGHIDGVLAPATETSPPFVSS